MQKTRMLKSSGNGTGKKKFDKKKQNRGKSNQKKSIFFRNLREKRKPENKFTGRKKHEKRWLKRTD